MQYSLCFAFEKVVSMCIVVKIWSVCASRASGSLQGLSGLSPSAHSECQCIPTGPREPGP